MGTSGVGGAYDIRGLSGKGRGLRKGVWLNGGGCVARKGRGLRLWAGLPEMGRGFGGGVICRKSDLHKWAWFLEGGGA